MHLGLAPHRVRRGVLACAAAASIALAACGPRQAETDRVLRFAQVGTASTLDPARYGWVVEGRVIEQVADGLLELDGNLKLRPTLAESWEALEGGRLFRFRLRAGATWGDGKPLRAEHVVAALTRLAEPGDVLGWTVISDVEGAEAYRLGKAKAVAGLEAPDERTVVVRLRRPSSRFLYQVATGPARILVGDGSLEDWQRGRVEGTGSFRLEAWEDRDVAGGRCQRFVLAARPGASAVARVGRLVIDLYRTGDDLLRGLRGESYDIVYAPPFEKPLVEERLPEHRLVLAPRLAFLSLYFDCGKPPVDRAQVRRAIVMAADRDVLPRSALSPGLFLPGLTAEEAILPPDPARARELARAAGLDPARPAPLRVGYSTSFEYGDVSRWVKGGLARSLAPLGLSVEAVEEPNGGALDVRSSARLDHAYIYGSTPELADACIFFDTFRSDNRSSNWSWYSRREVDEAYEECVGSLDPGAQRAAINRVKPLIMDDAPILPLAPIYQRVYQSPRVEGYVPGPLEGVSLRDVKVR